MKASGSVDDPCDAPETIAGVAALLAARGFIARAGKACGWRLIKYSGLVLLASSTWRADSH